MAQPKRYKAVAAMSLNRVIGAGNKIPWHLPEDFKWFKQLTSDHVIVMGRKTFESIGKPLPNRTTIVVSRSPLSLPGVEVISDLGALDSVARRYGGKEIFICGGAQIYAQTLADWSDLYLTVVQREVPGDALFPPFEEQFTMMALVMERADFKILHYRANSLTRKTEQSLPSG